MRYGVIRYSALRRLSFGFVVFMKLFLFMDVTTLLRFSWGCICRLYLSTQRLAEVFILRTGVSDFLSVFYQASITSWYTFRVDQRDAYLRLTNGYAFTSTSQIGGLAPDSRSLHFLMQEIDLRSGFAMLLYTLTV
ncbi:unnamed protein product [Arabis nemorensis]|uniref:Uncharacterized protein n=1 Tax=Arabis nemorensis TaxID=586526 RepID=A0A565B696_9BRAS|nr:unnamed protein product [Arabis nemorensis]